MNRQPFSLVSRAQIVVLVLVSAICAQTWPQHIIDNQDDGADGIRFADINGDGLLDGVSGWEEAHRVRIYLHPGVAAVTQRWPKATIASNQGALEDACFHDIDHDGAMDVISCAEANGRVAFHWGPTDAADLLTPSAWETAALPVTQGKSWMFAVPAQIDGTRGMDIVVGGKFGKLLWLRCPSDPRALDRWQLHEIASGGDWTMSVHPRDMDGDGDLDIIWLSRKGTSPGVRVLFNPLPDGDPAAPWEAVRVGGNEDAMLGAVVDMDNDGRLDILAPVRDEYTVQFYRQISGNGRQWALYSIPVESTPVKGVNAGDLDGDGAIDLAVAYVARPEWRKHNGTVLSTDWSARTLSGTGGKLDHVELYDVDRDGDLDYLTTCENGNQVVWYENPFDNGGAPTAFVDPFLAPAPATTVSRPSVAPAPTFRVNAMHVTVLGLDRFAGVLSEATLLNGRCVAARRAATHSVPHVFVDMAKEKR
ncbi:MAG: hypothetical protein GF331_21060 [Chitinivibrionales bacterium]|nr:hypothetical protein [Chitinivibrionales bacterium]